MQQAAAKSSSCIKFQGAAALGWPQSQRKVHAADSQPAGLCSFMVNLIFSAWIKFPAQKDKRDAIIMSSILAAGLAYILGVNLRWWHSTVSTIKDKVRSHARPFGVCLKLWASRVEGQGKLC